MNLTVEHSICLNNVDYEVTADVVFSPGRPAVMYLRNGDPGYPEDPAEVEIITAVSRPETPQLETICEMLMDDDNFLTKVSDLYAEKEYT